MKILKKLLIRFKQQKSAKKLEFYPEKYLEVFDVITHPLVPVKNLKPNLNNNIYKWGAWVEEIYSSVTLDCGKGRKYRDPLELEQINHTMIYPAKSMREIASKLTACEEVLGSKRMRLAVNDDIGTSLRLHTTKYGLASANNIHHLMHISEYIRCCGDGLLSSPCYIEFGGGYGNMARLVKIFNKDATYLIVDIPVILGIQYWYLANALGESHISICSDGKVTPGKVNLISTDTFLEMQLNDLLKDYVFISTWALTESPEWIQNSENIKYILKSAKKLLLASACDTNDFIYDQLNPANCKIKVPFLAAHHKYMFL